MVTAGQGRDPNKSDRIPALDGLRAVAILLVLVSHAVDRDRFQCLAEWPCRCHDLLCLERLPDHVSAARGIPALRRDLAAQLLRETRLPDSAACGIVSRGRLDIDDDGRSHLHYLIHSICASVVYELRRPIVGVSPIFETP
jgi:hypothetical protein